MAHPKIMLPSSTLLIDIHGHVYYSLGSCAFLVEDPNSENP